MDSFGGLTFKSSKGIWSGSEDCKSKTYEAEVIVGKCFN